MPRLSQRRFRFRVRPQSPHEDSAQRGGAHARRAGAAGDGACRVQCDARRDPQDRINPGAKGASSIREVMMGQSDI